MWLYHTCVVAPRPFLDIAVAVHTTHTVHAAAWQTRMSCITPDAHCVHCRVRPPGSGSCLQMNWIAAAAASACCLRSISLLRGFTTDAAQRSTSATVAGLQCSCRRSSSAGWQYTAAQQTHSACYMHSLCTAVDCCGVQYGPACNIIATGHNPPPSNPCAQQEMHSCL
jgi:hypothetical protein